MMLAARATGSETLDLLAAAPSADVLFDTGQNHDVTHDANGAGWYFNDSYSWGFAKQGDAVAKSSCDVGSVNPELRLCWHTSAGNMLFGWRDGRDLAQRRLQPREADLRRGHGGADDRAPCSA